MTEPGSEDPSPERSLRQRAHDAVDASYDPFESTRDSPPERGVWRYFPWVFEGLWWPIIGLVAAATAVGAVEVLIMAGVGEMLDRASASTPESFFGDQSGYLIWMAFLILLARPIAMTLRAAPRPLKQ